MKDDFTQHRVPSGACVFYRERDHAYFQGIEPEKKKEPDGPWKGRTKLTGVTTVVKPFDWEPGALMGWAVKTNIMGIAELCRDELERLDGEDDFLPRWLLDPEEIKRRLRDASLTDDDAREEAADRGTNVHESSLNALSEGAPVPRLAGLTDEERGHALAVSQFWLDHDPDAIQAEQVVCDLGLGIAGRLDFRGYLRARCEDETCPCHGIPSSKSVVILDLKTGRHIMAPAHVQVSGYDHCCRVSGFGDSQMQFLLQTFADPTDKPYKLIRSHGKREDFLSAVEIYRRQAEIMKQIRADEKAREVT